MCHLIWEDVKWTLLFYMNAALATLCQQQGDSAAVTRLTDNDHHLIRMWAHT